MDDRGYSNGTRLRALVSATVLGESYEALLRVQENSVAGPWWEAEAERLRRALLTRVGMDGGTEAAQGRGGNSSSGGNGAGTKRVDPAPSKAESAPVAKWQRPRHGR